MSRPYQIKITEDVSIILNNAVSYAIEKGLAHRKLKEGATVDEKTGKYTEDDFTISAADTISVYFLNGEGLTFRVGSEITSEDFERISKSLKALEFKLREGDSEGK